LLETEAGRSILVTVVREDNKEFVLRVPRDFRVHNLKHALKTKISLDMVGWHFT